MMAAASTNEINRSHLIRTPTAPAAIAFSRPARRRRPETESRYSRASNNATTQNAAAVTRSVTRGTPKKDCAPRVTSRQPMITPCTIISKPNVAMVAAEPSSLLIAAPTANATTAVKTIAINVAGISDSSTSASQVGRPGSVAPFNAAGTVSKDEAYAPTPMNAT